MLTPVVLLAQGEELTIERVAKVIVILTARI